MKITIELTDVSDTDVDVSVTFDPPVDRATKPTPALATMALINEALKKEEGLNPVDVSVS